MKPSPPPSTSPPSPPPTDAGFPADATLPPPPPCEGADLSAPWVDGELPTGTLDDLRTYLKAVETAMVGRWRGTATTQWQSGVYPVAVELFADGHYSAQKLTNSPWVSSAFYYGTDDEAPIKRYRLADLSVAGVAGGEIDIAFKSGNDFYLPGWQGKLSKLVLDASASRLRFDFQAGDGALPIVYDLARCR